MQQGRQMMGDGIGMMQAGEGMMGRSGTMGQCRTGMTAPMQSMQTVLAQMDTAMGMLQGTGGTPAQGWTAMQAAMDAMLQALSRTGDSLVGRGMMSAGSMRWDGGTMMGRYDGGTTCWPSWTRTTPITGSRSPWRRSGKRRQFASWSGKATRGAWHELRVEARGDDFQVYWDGTKVLDARDRTFIAPGRVGVWTKADSVTRCDNLNVPPK
jgi:hypothetical protein